MAGSGGGALRVGCGRQLTRQRRQVGQVDRADMKLLAGTAALAACASLIDVEPTEGFECRRLVARIVVELALELLLVVDHHRELIPHARDPDIEQTLVGEIALLARHDGDRLVGRDALRHVHVK